MQYQFDRECIECCARSGDELEETLCARCLREFREYETEAKRLRPIVETLPKSGDVVPQPIGLGARGWSLAVALWAPVEVEELSEHTVVVVDGDGNVARVDATDFRFDKPEEA